MKIQFASWAREFRHRALIFAAALIVVPTLLMSVSFSQDASMVKVPKHIPSDAAGAGARLGDQRTFGNKPIPPNGYEDGLTQWNSLSKAAPLLNPVPGKSTTGKSAFNTLATSLGGAVVWTPIGPSGLTEGTSIVNGRVDSIAVDPGNPNVLYLGATDGGVWKSIDAGADWTPLTDHEPMLAIGEPGAIAIDPTNHNTLYVGTSSFLKVTGQQGNQLNITIGILKSTDGGGSWIVLGSGFPAGNVGNANQFKNQSIFGIAVDPANNSDLYLAASSGLYVSTDAGLDWTLGTGGGGAQADSLAFDASSPPAGRVLFAGVAGVGIKRSTDGGMTWTTVVNSATTAVATQLAAHAGAGIGKVQVSLAPSVGNPAGVQVMYATIEGTGGNFPIAGSPYTNFLGIFETTDQGNTWTFQSTGPTSAGGVCQCFYTNTIAVDPGSPGDGINDIVYWGGTNTWKSTDSGLTFSDVTNGIHADSHSFAFAPGTPTIVYAGNDGGIWRTKDGGATWTGTGAGPATINTGSLQTTLFYHMDIKRNATANVTLGALQDNGTAQWTGALEWLNTLGGDGFNAVFDAQSVSDAYAANNGNPQMSSNSGGTWSAIATGITAGQVSAGSNAISVDPNTAGTLYFSGAANGSNPGQLFRSTNFGALWGSIFTAPTLSTLGPTAIAPSNSNNLIAAIGGSVFVTTNALAVTPVFTNITRNLPGANITRLAFDPNDANTIYVVLSGFGTGHVFTTTITGSTWTDISPPNLNVPFDALVLDGASSPSTIYAGCDLGVLRSVDGGATWTTLDAVHFPNVIVSDLQLNPTAHVLRASTYGRGVFEFAAASGPVIAVNPQNNLQFGSTCSGNTVSLNLEIFNVGTTNLVINSVQRQAGSADFTVAPNPMTPVTISPDAHVDFTIQFTPTIVGSQSATIAISSNDPGAPTTLLTATGSEGTGTINVTGSGSFGTASCSGTTPTQTLQINNVGNCNLQITGVMISCPDFTLVNPSEFPATISPDSELPVGINFTPTSAGPKSCSLTIDSTDPVNPVVIIPLTGNTATGTASLTFPAALTFAPTVIQASAACSSSLGIPIANAGTCPVQIKSIGITQTSTLPPNLDYSLTGLPTLPLSVPAGGQLGSGDFDLAFAPFVLNPARFDSGTVDVTFVNDPITGATATTHVPFCGEGVRRGVRVLVTQGGVPVPVVKRIFLQNAFTPEQQTGQGTIKILKNVALQAIPASGACPMLEFQGEFGGVSDPYQLKDGGYRIKVQIKVGKKIKTKVVRATVDVCTFSPNILVAFP